MTSKQENDAAFLAAQFINNTNCPIFLTGKAGTGKTTFLKKIIHHTYKNTLICAPTGIAAINAGGVTIHSLFQIPFGTFVPTANYTPEFHSFNKINTTSSIFKEMRMAETKRRLIREAELLIIDEVSMLRADVLDAMDTVMRSVRRNKNEAFGGLQVLFIGDMLQLPPVVKDQEWMILREFYNSIYFFEAHALRNNKPLYIELEKIYRQEDLTFIRILNHLRENSLTEDDLEILNDHYQPNFTPSIEDGYVHLTTHNKKAEETNNSELEKIIEPVYKFKAIITGEFSEYSYPIEETLELKKGAQVMFVKNDYSGKQHYFNGKIGLISKLNENEIHVSFSDTKETVLVERYSWENKRYTLNEDINEIEETVLGTFEQYPIRLAWAITVHKSQGLTFTRAMVDVSGAFAAGQIYVALSRLTSLDGLILTSPIPESIIEQDKNLRDFMHSKENTESLHQYLKSESKEYFRKYILETFNFSTLVSDFRDHLNSYQGDPTKSQKQKHYEWAQQYMDLLVPIRQVGDRFIMQLQKITQADTDEFLPFLYERVKSAKQYFEPLFQTALDNVNKHIDIILGFNNVKTYLAELRDVENLVFKNLQKIHKVEKLLQAVLENREFSKQELLESDLYKNRIQAIQEKNEIKPIEAPKKDTKTPTRLQTLALFNEKKSLTEIAKERGLSVQTIEGHLADCIFEGDVSCYELIEKYVADKIIAVADELDTYHLNPIKEQLSDEYSYTDIKYALAHLKHLKKTKAY